MRDNAGPGGDINNATCHEILLSVLIVSCHTHDENNFISWENMKLEFGGSHSLCENLTLRLVVS